jgi:hypothetical protein
VVANRSSHEDAESASFVCKSMQIEMEDGRSMECRHPLQLPTQA